MIDNLRELNDKVNAFVNYTVKTACERTTSGQYYVSVDDACKAAGMSHEDFLQFKDFIISELHTREELLDFDFSEDSMEFDLNCGLKYCPGYQWCEGDEDIFECSYEEWLEKPAIPVAQPLSLSRMAEIAVEAIEELKCVSFDREWYSQVVDNLGFGPEEAAVFGLEDGLVLDDTILDNNAKLKEQEEVVGTIVYQLTNSYSETVKFTDVKLFLAAYADALDTYGPNGCTATLFSDDLPTRYEFAKISYGCYGEDIEPFDEWKAKIEADEKLALDEVIKSCEKVSKKADVIDINEYRSSKEER